MPEMQEYFEQFCQLGQEEHALIANQDIEQLGYVVSRREDVMREFLDSAGQCRDDVF